MQLLDRYVELYAADQPTFFKDFASAFSRLVALGCPDQCQPKPGDRSPYCPKASEAFRTMAMHGSLEHMREIASKSSVDVRSADGDSGRTALHKAVPLACIELLWTPKRTLAIVRYRSILYERCMTGILGS